MDSDDEDDDNDKDLVFNSTFGGTGAYAVNRGNDPDAEFEGYYYIQRLILHNVF